MPDAASAHDTAVEPLETAWAYLAPVIFRTSASNSRAFQMFLRWASWLYRKRIPVSSTSLTSFLSSAPNNSVPGIAQVLKMGLKVLQRQFLPKLFGGQNGGSEGITY